MLVLLAILGSLGGVATFVGGIWFGVKAIFRLVNSTESNTNAVRELTAKVEAVNGRLAEQGERLARLEGRI